MSGNMSANANFNHDVDDRVQVKLKIKIIALEDVKSNYPGL